MVAQKGIRHKAGFPPIRYGALEICLHKLAERALALGATVHMPRIGCGLAGGSWDQVEPIVRKMLVDRGVSVVVYDFPEDVDED